MDTLVELHDALALHGADVNGRRKAPLRERLLALVEEEEEAAEDRRFAEFGDVGDEAGNAARYEARDEAGLQPQVGEEGEHLEFDAAAAPRQGRDVPRRESKGAFLPRLSSRQLPTPAQRPAARPAAFTTPPSAAIAAEAAPRTAAARETFARANAAVAAAAAASAAAAGAAPPKLQMTPEVLRPSKIQRGDYVIHKSFGIGRFEGLYKKREVTIQWDEEGNEFEFQASSKYSHREHSHSKYSHSK